MIPADKMSDSQLVPMDNMEPSVEDAGDEDLLISDSPYIRKRPFPVEGLSQMVKFILSIFAFGAAMIVFSVVLLFVTHKFDQFPSQPFFKIESCQNIPAPLRFDCYPYPNATEEKCTRNGCCWRPVSTPLLVRKSIPYCYYPTDYKGYRVTEGQETESGKKLVLDRSTTTGYPDEIMKLVVEVVYETPERLHIKIIDPENERYEIPMELVRRPTQIEPLTAKTKYTLNITEDRFSMKVVREETGLVLLDTDYGAFIYSNQFIQLSTTLPSKFIYGLGEHMGKLLYTLDEWDVLTMWDVDRPPIPGVNLYGSYPFYINMETTGTAHGFLLMNSNGLDVILQPGPAITWRAIGGILDMYMFMGPTPADVVRQYIEVIGHPILPPYWSLGFHLCRWKYGTAANTRMVNERNRNASIPLDVQWNDIDYMHDFLDFEYSPGRFRELPQLVDDLHELGQHYVLMIDPAISAVQPHGSYPPYDMGAEMDIFVKMNDTSYLIGEVWPGKTVYPDFTNPKSEIYWTKMMSDFHDEVAFDGVWLDMNEPTNMVDGSINGCPNDTMENPLYLPNIVDDYLASKTLCMTAKQKPSFHYDLHNLYGHSELLRTSRAMRSIRKKRPFIISRSTFPSSGRYAGHWLGDNKSQWQYLVSSIPGILNFNMFGIPLVGPDICGFDTNATFELCRRWHQLGAFYPFARNHNANNTIDQDPAAFGQEMIESTRKALLTRYKLLPYLYTLFFEAHTQGSTVARPLFIEFSNDVNTYNIDRQFLWGPGLLISPVLEDRKTHVEAYFPESMWYDYYTGKLVTTVARVLTLDTPPDAINLHVRGGVILPYQEPNVTTTTSRNNDFGLIVPLDENGSASGSLYWDDGDSINTTESGAYTLIKFHCADNHIVSHMDAAFYAPDADMILGRVEVYGVTTAPENVTVNSDEVNFSFDSNLKVLNITGISVTLLNTFDISWE